MNLFLGFLYGLIAQVLTFLQLQGQLKIEWIKTHKWIAILAGVPISWLYMQSVKYFVLAFGGQIWPSRLIGFAIGVSVFTAMSILLFGEEFSLKTGICLALGLAILLIQLLWR